MKSSRQKHFVDPEVQGLLLKKAIVNWLACLAIVALGVVGAGLLLGKADSIWERLVHSCILLGPALFLALLALPIVAWDSVRTSSRFAGPIHRLQRALKLLSVGEMTNRVFFREQDCWKDLAIDFNHLAKRINLLQQERDMYLTDSSLFSQRNDRSS